MMKGLFRQLSDLFAYVLIPAFAVVTPSSWSRFVLRRASHWRWLMSEPAQAACNGATQYVEIEDMAEWIARWKQVEMLDVRDLYMLMYGRAKTVLDEIDCEVPVGVSKDRVMIGMHYGPSISILKLLQAAELEPALPYRPPEKSAMWIRPFFYVFSAMAARYMVKTMGERAVSVGGAGQILRRMMGEPGSVFVVMDAPPMEGRPVLHVPVLDKVASFNKGFPDILEQGQKEYVLYAMNLHPDGSLRKRLELKGPFSHQTAQQFINDYSVFLDQHLASDSAHWRIWHVANQFWRPQDQSPV
jgi:hypothetical protein